MSHSTECSDFCATRSNKALQFPQINEIFPVSSDIWIVKSHFALGKGQTDGLTWKKLKERLFAALPDGLDSNIFDDTCNESTAAQLREEKQMYQRLINGEELDFTLDTTMTIIRLEDETLCLHSPVPFNHTLHEKIQDLGDVSSIVAPNLQHWLFVEDWARHWDEAKIFVAPQACSESVYQKLSSISNIHSDRINILASSGSQISPCLWQTLLEGAPLNMNEILFYHSPSKTLIASDGFYGGHDPNDPLLTWFARVWFKVTKGAWSNKKLPIYRTSRVKTHGDIQAVQNCVDKIIKDWDFERILFAHGTNPFSQNPKEAFKQAWHSI